MPQTVVLLGDLGADTLRLDSVASEFGWSMEGARDLNQLRDLALTRKVVAVLFDARVLGLRIPEALESVRIAAPQAHLVACHRFSDAVDWPELAEAGAFHALALPLKRSEVRQSLGFVWSARLHRASKVVPLRAGERRNAVPEKADQLRDAS